MADTVKPLGFAVIGLGMAGKVRVRELKSLEDDSYSDWKGPDWKNVKLKAIVSRRDDHGVEDVERLTQDEVLSRSDINAVIVATENTTHYEITKKALEAGKHVLVEFPLVVDYDQQLDPLYNLAKEKGVVLYEEDIALLTPQHRRLKQEIQIKEETTKLVCAQSWLTGSIKGDVATYMTRTGHPLYAGISVLQCLMDVFGDMDPVAATMEMTEKSISVKAKLRLKETAKLRIKREDGAAQKDSDSDISISIERMVTDEPMRKKTFSFEFEDGSILDDSKVMSRSCGPPNLFFKDLTQFVDVVRGNKCNKHSEWITRRSHEITAQLVNMTGRGGGESQTAGDK